MPFFKSSTVREEKSLQKTFHGKAKELKKRAAKRPSIASYEEYLTFLSTKEPIMPDELASLKDLYDACGFDETSDKRLERRKQALAKLASVPRFRDNEYTKVEKEIEKSFKKVRERQDWFKDLIEIVEISKLCDEADAFYNEVPQKLTNIKAEITAKIDDLEHKYAAYADIPEFLEIKIEEIWDIGTLDVKRIGHLSLAAGEVYSTLLNGDKRLSDPNDLQRWKERVRESDRAVLREIKEDIVDIKRDFINDQRQITANNRQRAQEMRDNHSNTNTNSTATRLGELKELKELLDSGALTQEEFDSEKAKILNS